MRIFAKAFSLTFTLLLSTLAAGQSASEAQDQAASPATGGEPVAQAQQPHQPKLQARGQKFGEWFDKAARAYQQQDIEGWVEATEELHRLRPYNQDFMRHLVEGNARLGNLDKAYDMMLRMQRQGLSVDWDAIDAVEPMREHQLYDHLNSLMEEAGQPFGDVTTWSRLGDDHPMPEAMAYDGERERMFVGTVRDGKILTSDDGEAWTTWVAAEDMPELQAVFDMVVDAERGHLWVATGNIAMFQGEPREDEVNSALLRLDLETGELQREYPIGSGGGRNLLGSLAVTGEGTVFAADMQAPVIYRLEAGAEALSPYFGHPGFTSLRGMALNEDGSLLYVADYALGIFVIDASGGQQAWQLAVPETFNAGGIDGLFWWDNHLVVIQNAITPQRVVRLQLGDDGLGVTAVAPLAAAREEFDMPTFGVMDGQQLYFLAVSHWRHADAEGNPKDEWPEVPIMSVDVDNASVKTVGQEVLEKLKGQQQGQQPDSEG
jgi:pentatricopeptide repeat protein